MSSLRKIYNFLYTSFQYHGRRFAQITPTILIYLLLYVTGYATPITILALAIIGAAFAVWLEDKYVSATIIEKQYSIAGNILTAFPRTATATVIVFTATFTQHFQFTRLWRTPTRRPNLEHVSHVLQREKVKTTIGTYKGITLPKADEAHSAGTAYIKS